MIGFDKLREFDKFEIEMKAPYPHVYVNPDPQSLDLESVMPQLPRQRIEKIRAFRFEKDKKLSASVYLLLSEALEKEWGIKEIPDFIYGENEKPFLSGLPAVHFNLSHCDAAAVCAVSDHPVGIDVEEIKPHEDDLMRHVLSPEEYEKVKNSEQPEIEFLRFWTMKESYLKLTGEGLNDNLPGLLPAPGIIFQTVTDASGKFIYTVCQFAR